MAEINVVRKGFNIWPWVIGAALVVIAAFVWMNRDGDTLGENRVIAPATAGDRSAERTGGAPMPSAVTAFVAFAESRPPSGVGPAHAYTATGIERLATALQAIAESDAQADQALASQLGAFREKAERLQADPASREHSTLVREVFTSAASVMTTLQQHRADAAGAREQIDGVRAAAEAVDANRPLLEQTERVTVFFDRASDTLQVLARARQG